LLDDPRVALENDVLGSVPVTSFLRKVEGAVCLCQST
jgi:hypothetical protein